MNTDQNQTDKINTNLSRATLGGGCFWCLEAIYQELQGIDSIVSGYSGGTIANPTYNQIGTGRTGHAEVVQLTFDPQIISYQEILQVFFSIHDPTTLNRQGADVGPQYRSIILYHDDEQKQVAQSTIANIEAQKLWDDPIVTELAPFTAFYKAEDYHQNYYRDNSYQPYCQVVINPKVTKFRKQFSERLKS